MFCSWLSVPLSLFFWPLCCMSFFDLNFQNYLTYTNFIFVLDCGDQEFYNSSLPLHTDISAGKLQTLIQLIDWLIHCCITCSGKYFTHIQYKNKLNYAYKYIEMRERGHTSVFFSRSYIWPNVLLYLCDYGRSWYQPRSGQTKNYKIGIRCQLSGDYMSTRL